MKKWLILLLAGAASVALAQPVTQQAVTGNECWNAGQGPGGTGTFLCINQVRNGNGITTFSGTGAVATIATQNTGSAMWTGAAPTTWTITLPNPAFDGEVFQVGTDTTLTTMVTVQAGTTPQNQTMSAAFSAQTVTAGTSVLWQYSNTLSKWFKVR